MYDKILFLDFDGTITTEDTLNGSLLRTVDPAVYREKHRELLEGKQTLSEILRAGFGLVTADKLPLIMEYVRSVQIRDGFGDLLKAMKEQHIPVVVISGGLKPYIDEKLTPYRDLILDVYSIEIDTSGGNIKLLPAYEADGELMQKTLIMQRYDYQTAICAGDSLTDIRMAMASDIVFARDQLTGFLDQRNVEYVPWHDFYDIRDYILNLN